MRTRLESVGTHLARIAVSSARLLEQDASNRIHLSYSSERPQ